MNNQEKINQLIEAGDKATKLDLSSAEYFDEGQRDCPLCDGEGSVHTETYWNLDDVPLNVQFSGVGKDHVNWHSFVTAAANTREAVKAMVAENESLANTINAIHEHDLGNSDQILNENARLATENERMREALEEIACLGNHGQHGNSDGNMLAIQALKGKDDE
jgi:hypothetical protein